MFEKTRRVGRLVVTVQTEMSDQSILSQPASFSGVTGIKIKSTQDGSVTPITRYAAFHVSALAVPLSLMRISSF